MTASRLLSSLSPLRHGCVQQDRIFIGPVDKKTYLLAWQIRQCCRAQALLHAHVGFSLTATVGMFLPSASESRPMHANNSHWNMAQQGAAPADHESSVPRRGTSPSRYSFQGGKPCDPAPKLLLGKVCHHPSACISLLFYF